ncbi:MAB_1171c family putative transporter [Streptomyces sp. NPDC046915]|uniref:MAB_1171c family putative transporter n=1 Tax=Streptomyces sp. NPDC046915 TaxID=3155257 RepID=UPI0033DE4432
MLGNTTGHIAAYAVPGALAAVAFAIKLPLLRRARHDPILRATALLLAIGVVTFVSLPPQHLHRINEITGVPNFAAPWAYSLITAYCGACLWLVILWRKPPSPGRRRQIRLVWAAYAAIIAGLWVTFLLGDHRVERLRDLDTYYANTPWMREHIVLYLLAHTASSVVTTVMLWAWSKEIDKGWVRRAVVCLLLAYAFGFLYDVAKLCAVGARWAGWNWDWLSTYAAPPFSVAEAFLVAVGFILGQLGPLVEGRLHMRRAYRRLEPLWRLLQPVTASPAPTTGRVGGAALQLELRKATINDGLLRLTPHLSDTRRTRARRAALAAGHPERAARGIAGAVDVLVAVDALRAGRAATVNGRSSSPGAAPDGELEAIARALRHQRSAVETFHHEAAVAEGFGPRA